MHTQDCWFDMKADKSQNKNQRAIQLKQFDLGANRIGQGIYLFKVWAPRCAKVMLKLFGPTGVAIFGMDREEEGYFSVQVPLVEAGMRYSYVLDNGVERPDPAARSLPVSPHGPSEMVDPESFYWTDQKWKGIDLSGQIFYEVHVGTFTSEGTFAAIIKKVPYLKKLGITCLEIMPVARFPGERNWGYDGTGLYAVQPGYGGSQGLKELVNACHQNGIAVCLDVVYNHLGPEGNYLREFGPYFTGRYQVPWGEAVNFDGWDSDPVRLFFVENARYWIREFHIDALRLDAVHAIYDFSARHILEQINAAVEDEGRFWGRHTLVIAESDLNDARLISPVARGGYGLAGQWSDDFHHAVHALLTGERNGYYQDFGSLTDLAKAFAEGFVYDGRHSAFRHRRHGNKVKSLPPEKLVVAIQNHDQVGNRAFGDRFGTLLSFEAQKLAAALLLLSPNTPLLFMGEEYGEKAPFQYFIDHQDAELVRLVREGRQKEFASFGWNNVPDPKSEDTFSASKLNWSSLEKAPHSLLLKLYQDLIKTRKRYFSGQRKVIRTFTSDDGWFAVEYLIGKKDHAGVIFSFSKEEQILRVPFRSGKFLPVLFTQAVRYGGDQKKVVDDRAREMRLSPMSAVFGKLS